MKFKYVGDKKLISALDNAENQSDYKQAERNLYAQLPYIEAYGYRFTNDSYTEVDTNKRISDVPGSPLVVDKLKLNSHFEMHEIKDVTPNKDSEPKKAGRPKKVDNGVNKISDS